MESLAAKNVTYYFESIKSDSLGFYFSFIFHLVILLFAVGLPNFFETKPINIPNIIPIEIINISDTTSIPEKIIETKKNNLKNIKIKEKKFNSSNLQEIKKIEIKKKVEIDQKLVKKKVTPKENILIKEKKRS